MKDKHDKIHYNANRANIRSARNSKMQEQIKTTLTKSKQKTFSGRVLFAGKHILKKTPRICQIN